MNDTPTSNPTQSSNSAENSNAPAGAGHPLGKDELAETQGRGEHGSREQADHAPRSNPSVENETPGAPVSPAATSPSDSRERGAEAPGSGRLAGKVALVTGGSEGIGLATAKELSAEGARVFISGRRQAELDAAVAAIGNGAIGVQADVSQNADLDKLYAEITAKAGNLDILVANAGIGGEMQPLSGITEEVYRQVFDINVKGTIFTVQKALPVLRDGGTVILMASIVGSKGTENFSVYSASKAAIRNFARTWLIELKTRQIRVNVISPGPIDTPGLAGIVPPDQKDGFIQMMASMVPMGRIGQPSEIGKAAVFLASDDSSFVNGLELFVDGGFAQI